MGAAGAMTTFVALLFLVSITCDVAGQLFFKLGATAAPVGLGEGIRPHLIGFVSNVWLQAGLLTYAVELVIWLRILAEVPVSIAFPVASLNFLGVALASRFVLREELDWRQWAGTGLVTIGVALVAGSA